MSVSSENGGMALTDKPLEKSASKVTNLLENGIESTDEKPADEVKVKPVNGTAEHLQDGEVNKAEDGKEEDGKDTAYSNTADQLTDKKEDMEVGESKHADDASVLSNDSVRSVDTPVVLSDNGVSENVESVNTSSVASPVTVDSRDPTVSEESRESLDSKESEAPAIEISSNNGAVSDTGRAEDNDSQNPSMISEDSRDSVHSNNSLKSSNDKKEALVETVKDGDGDEILITLNNEDDKKGEEAMETDSPSKSDSGPEKTDVEKKVENNVDKSESKDVKPASEIGKSNLPPPPPLTPAPGVMTSVASALKAPVTQTIGIPVNSIPPGAQIAQQGNKFGYITQIGNQTLFVPLPMSSTAGTAPVNSAVILNQLALQQQQKSGSQVKAAAPTAAATQQQQLSAEELKPKSSWEMMELMRWEVQNRISDNWNWSVAFHPKKEELSSVTSFLQELGSDVVKEQVYKDIIQIQTKKKHAGELKDAEVDSLEKMKTVYENTKKKVEHLQLKTRKCKLCDFKTESPVVMEYHKDFPHFDPPWDMIRGTMMCSFCNFRTKVVAQFIFHLQDVHKRQAKFIERDQHFQCSLCPLNASSKGKLEKHQGKCMKHFKLHVNLQPYYHDVNYCMKSCYYKPKKPIVKPPPPPPKPVPRPSTAMHTRQHGSVVQPPLLPQPQRAVRPVTGNVARPPFQAPQIQQRPAVPSNNRVPTALQVQPRPTKPHSKEMAGFEVCEMCGGYVKDRQALRIHFYYAHKVELPQAMFQRANPPLSCDVCKSLFWTTQGLTKHKTTMRHFTQPVKTTPSSTSSVGLNQQCFMCLRKVGNLFAHFEQTHGVTMKDMVLMKKCIICGITAVDRRSLEVHMATSHGVLIKANDYVTEKPAAAAAPAQKVASIPSGPKQGKNIGKINFCVFCEIQFPDNIQLTVHCMKKHATCRECGMVVLSSNLLANHNCMKANRRCCVCGLANMTPDSYANHLKKHIKPCKVKIESLTPEQIENAKEKLKREYKPAVISLDSDEDSDVEVVETKPSNMKVVLEKKDSDEKAEMKKEDSVEKDGSEKMTDSKTEKLKADEIVIDADEDDKKAKEGSEMKKSETEKTVESTGEKDDKTGIVKPESDETGESEEKEVDGALSENTGIIAKKEPTDQSSGEKDGTVKTEPGDTSEYKEMEVGSASVENSGIVPKEESADKSENDSQNGTSKSEPVDTSEYKEMDVDCASAENMGIKEESDTVTTESVEKSSVDNDSVKKEDKMESETTTDNQDSGMNIKTEQVESPVQSGTRSAENADVKDEVINEDELLGKNEDSNDSGGSLKRKKADSDIDEDELLRDETEIKRPKIEPSDNTEDESGEKDEQVEKETNQADTKIESSDS